MVLCTNKNLNSSTYFFNFQEYPQRYFPLDNYLQKEVVIIFQILNST